MKRCVRCQKPVEDGRRKYCSEACAERTPRALKKIRAAGERAAKRTYRYRQLSFDEAARR